MHLSQKLNNFFSQIKIKQAWNKLYKQPLHFWIAVVIFALGLLLRVYNLPANVMFLGDQGRDALAVSQIFKEKDLVFIGPVTSIGNMYLGPFYYYFMLPFLWLTYPSPLGPVYAVALLSSVAVFLIYFFGKKMFNHHVGLFAALFLGLSATAIQFSRFSWNPNLAPLIGLVMIFVNWKALRKPKYWIGVLLCFSILIQLHYVTLLSGVSALFLWLHSFLKLKAKQQEEAEADPDQSELWSLLKPTLIGLLIVAASLLPLLLFDLKHQGLNLKAFASLLTQEEGFTQSDQTIWKSLLAILVETEGRAMHILTEYNLGKYRNFNRLVVIILVAIFGLKWLECDCRTPNSKTNKTNDKQQALLVLGVYFLIGVLGTAAYQHTIFNHYIAYLFPVAALMYGLACDWLLSQHWLGVVPTIAFVGYFLYYNLPQLPLTPNNSFFITRRTARVIASEIDEDEKYNIVLLSESQDLYGQNYRYFLSTTVNPPLKIGQSEQAETLIIIDELKNPNQATNNDIYEIVIFPDKQIDKSIRIKDGPNVYFLEK